MRARPSAACCCTLLLVVCAAALPDTAPSTASSNARAHQDDVGHRRVRRQNGEVVESIFQIPIQTLMAVSKVFTTGIQSIQRTREQFFQATRPSTSSLTSSGAGAALQQQYQQYQQYRPQKPYRPARPSAGTSSSSAYSSAYAALTRPNYNYVYSGYVYPRGGGATAAGASKSHAASVAGVGTQGDGSSYRI